jgi:L-lysine exporter family protein LysE/ArgO
MKAAMSHLGTFLNGFIISAALIIAIGAQNAFVLRQGLRREHVGAIVAFCALADALLIGAGVAGLGALIGAAPVLTSALTVGGAAFLTGYGITALARSARPDALAVQGTSAMSLPAALASTAGFTLLNPHVYLDTVLLVGAVGASHPPANQPIFVAGAACASALWFTTLGYGARALAPLFAKPIAWRLLDLLVGAMMLSLAAGLIWGAVRH